MKRRCLETRRKGSLTHRRYRTESGRDIRTVEIPLTVYRSLRRIIDPRAEAWGRGEVQRERLASLLLLRAQGVKQEYIAARLGISQQSVSKALRNHAARR